MKSLRANAHFWIAGILTAFAGVALARVIAPLLTGNARICFTATGQFIALGGLFVLCLGVRRRVNRGASQ